MIPERRGGGEAAPSRRYPAAPIVGVGAVIAASEREVVLVRRARAPLLGHWSLPGGALELGESLRLAVAREVREETGLDVEVGPIVDVTDHVEVDDDGRVTYHFVIADFLCWPIAGVLRAGDDVDDVAVVADGDLDRYGVTEVTRAVIRQAFERYTAQGRRS